MRGPIATLGLGPRAIAALGLAVLSGCVSEGAGNGVMAPGDGAVIEVTSGSAFSGGFSTVFREDGSWSNRTSGPFGEGAESHQGKGTPDGFQRARGLLEARVPTLNTSAKDCPEDGGYDSIRFAPPIAGRDSVASCPDGAVGRLIADVSAAWRG